MRPHSHALLLCRLNPGFASRVRLYGNLVYDENGSFPLLVPNSNTRVPLQLGMTGA